MSTTGCMSGLHERLDRLLHLHGSNNRTHLYDAACATTTIWMNPSGQSFTKSLTKVCSEQMKCRRQGYTLEESARLIVGTSHNHCGVSTMHKAKLPGHIPRTQAAQKKLAHKFVVARS